MAVRVTTPNGLISTARSGVGPLKLYKGQLYQNDPGFLDNSLFTLALDWLDIMCEGELPESSDEAKMHDLGGDVVLEWRGGGTAMMKTSYTVWVAGEKFGTLGAHPRTLEKGLKARSVTLHIENALLYTDYWHSDLQHVLDVTGLLVQNVTRCDIALDGLNYIWKFLNDYQRQTAENKAVHHKGRARFNAGVLDRTTMEYQSFKIGSGSSEKQISVYNKTLELEKSNKTYIRQYWLNNGIDADDDECPIFRVELRLRGKAIKEIKDFDLQKLTDYGYLFDMFKTGCHNYFEFTLTRGHKNVTRQQPIDLIPFDKLGAKLLAKVPRPLSDGRYKAKMSVHLVVKDVVMGILPEVMVPHALGTADQHVRSYDLQRWLSRALPRWLKHYGKLAGANKRDAPPRELVEFIHAYARADA